jgi:predicted nucleotide-binding protein
VLTPVIGTLQPAHVVAIVRGVIERPSDFDGVVYISFDRSDWRMELAKELRAGGFDIDLKALA